MTNIFMVQDYKRILLLLCNHKFVRKNTLLKEINRKHGYPNRLNVIIRQLQRNGFNIRKVQITNNSKSKGHATVYFLEQGGVK